MLWRLLSSRAWAWADAWTAKERWLGAARLVRNLRMKHPALGGQRVVNATQEPIHGRRVAGPAPSLGSHAEGARDGLGPLHLRATDLPRVAAKLLRSPPFLDLSRKLICQCFVTLYQVSDI